MRKFTSFVASVVESQWRALFCLLFAVILRASRVSCSIIYLSRRHEIVVSLVHGLYSSEFMVVAGRETFGHVRTPMNKNFRLPRFHLNWKYFRSTLFDSFLRLLLMWYRYCNIFVINLAAFSFLSFWFFFIDCTFSNTSFNCPPFNSPILATSILFDIFVNCLTNCKPINLH